MRSYTVSTGIPLFVAWPYHLDIANIPVMPLQGDFRLDG
jgi:hypothetical protein